MPAGPSAGTGAGGGVWLSPGSATVTHELTHSIVNRTLGEGGGSWFQEGIAVHVENRWQRKSGSSLSQPISQRAVS